MIWHAFHEFSRLGYHGRDLDIQFVHKETDILYSTLEGMGQWSVESSRRTMYSNVFASTVMIGYSHINSNIRVVTPYPPLCDPSTDVLFYLSCAKFEFLLPHGKFTGRNSRMAHSSYS